MLSFVPYFVRTHIIIKKMYESVSKSFRTSRLEREIQMVQLCATRCSFIAILWLSLVSFAAITLCGYFSTSVRSYYCLFLYRLSPEKFAYTLVLLYVQSCEFSVVPFELTHVLHTRARAPARDEYFPHCAWPCCVIISAKEMPLRGATICV
jgi:hypothetical protein